MMWKWLRGAGLVLLVFIGVLAAAAQDTTPATTQNYTIQPRDTLDSIGARFDVRWQCLAERNNITNPYEDVRPGQNIVIDFSCPRYEGVDFVTNPREEGQPVAVDGSDSGQGGGAVEPGPNDRTYTVRAADTLDTIAQREDVSVVSLQLANGLATGERIFPGDTLIIPEGAPPYGTFPAITDPLNLDEAALGQGGGGPELGPNDQEYVVQPRDTLDRIAARYDMQTSCLAERNSIMTPFVLYPGQVVVLFADCPAYDGFDVVTNPRGS